MMCHILINFSCIYSKSGVILPVMDQILLIIFSTLMCAAVLNIIFKRLGVSHIIGYIVTGIVISYVFGFNGVANVALETAGEFGIVFLMFTIGLELGLGKLRKMKEILVVNGALQVVLSSVVIFTAAFYLFDLAFDTALIVALAFSLSSTAIVLTYLKQSKDILTPYGQKTMGILVFQDLAVIPILLLLTFLSAPDADIVAVVFKTLLSALAVLVLMMTLGRSIVSALLKFSAQTELEELFLGAVFAIVLGSALLAHAMGFTYSLGAFIAGMLIADSDFSVKAESDISSYRDLLLGIFFFAVGTKINLLFFLQHLHQVLAVFVLVFLFKAVVIYFVLRRNSDKNSAVKTALALSQIGEFSFAVFALAASQELIDKPTANFLILVSVVSMIVTPFILKHIYKLSSLFEKEFYEADVITPIGRKGHIVVAGFSTLGKIVSADLHKKGMPFVIISDNLKQVLHARKLGYMAYFGHLDRRPVLESLNVDEADAVIITISSEHGRRLVAEAVRRFSSGPKIVVKIASPKERKILKSIEQITLVDVSFEIGRQLVEQAIEHQDASDPASCESRT